MSYTFDLLYDMVARGQIDYASSTGFYMGLVLDGTSLAASGQPSATGRGGITNLQECNFTNYARVNISGVTLTLDTTAHEERWTFSPVTFTALGSATTEVVGAFIQYTSGSGSTVKILHYFDTKPLFPFTANGNDKVITSPTAGAVRFSG